jgi:hypothetical protein
MSTSSLSPVSADQFSSLSERVSQLERQMSSFSAKTRDLKPLRIDLDKLKTAFRDQLHVFQSTLNSVEFLQTVVRCLAEDLVLRTAPPTPQSIAEVPIADDPSHYPVEIPMETGKPLDGIISYLTTKHGGNVHDMRIVTVTSKSVAQYGTGAPQNVVDLASRSVFESEDHGNSDQWISWDFRNMRVRLTHYTIKTLKGLRSWSVQGSLDGDRWTEIDRQWDRDEFDCLKRRTVSFAVRKPAEFRLIRLVQWDRFVPGDPSSYSWNDRQLLLVAVEFFGTLCE